MSESVLQQIALSVRKRLEERKNKIPMIELESQISQFRKPYAFLESFRAPGVQVISEVKFKSPALGELDSGQESRAVDIASQYFNVGATAISVLTETDYFKGSLSYLAAIRLACPQARLLMKDFVLEEYQILEALVHGADAILLILSLLGKERAQVLMRYASQHGLTSLVEVHDEEELEQAHSMKAEFIGINNRNLKTLEVSLTTSFELIQKRRPGFLYISESGIRTGTEIKSLSSAGFSGFLIGTAFMKGGNPGEELRQLLDEVKR